MLALLVSIALLIVGALLIWINTADMQQEIYLDGLTYAELTNDTIVTSYEQFYETRNFLQYRKDVNPILTQNIDVEALEVVGKSGDLLYDSRLEQDVQYEGELRKNTYGLERVRSLKPSLVFSNGRVVFARKDAENQWRAVTDDDELIVFPNGQVKNIIFPHNNFRHNVVYSLTYDALWDRITMMIVTIIASILGSIILATLIGYYFAGKLVRPVQQLERGVEKIAKGAFGSQIPVTTEDEIGALTVNFNNMSKTLKKNTKELLIKEKLTQELEFAKDIQQNMLPDKAPKIKGLDVAGSLTPATQIGGDIYDFLETKSGDPMMFIADVTGHGVPAGLVASITHSSLYSFSEIYESTADIFKAMNKVVHTKTNTNMFATALLAKWDRKTQSLKYSNAGHEEMLYYNAQSQNLSLVERGGMALGMTPNIDKLIEEKEQQLSSGDVIIMYTDGIPEAWRTKKENLGMDAFMKMAQDAIAKNKHSEGIRKGIIKRLTRYREKYPQQDDITIVVIMKK